MTTLVSWITDDQHSTASLYIASDSRLSELKGHGQIIPKSDIYKKTFCSKTTPDIFGIFGSINKAHEIL